MRIPLLPWFFLIPFCYFLLIHILVVSCQCSDNQQQSLLLQLKNSLIFDGASSTKLVKWNNASDYCSWAGVYCEGGCVTHLDLSNESISGGLDNSSDLFSLQYIKNLNLAYNNFNYIQIPSEFSKLASLSYLNLSNAGFAGQIPIEISYLTRLVLLDLSTLYFPGTPSLKLDDPDLNLLIGNLSEITELHLDGVDISAQRTHWCQAISSSLPNLRVLSLSACNLSGPFDDSLLKLQSLSDIRIERNNLSTLVPEFLSNFTNLTSLRLMNSGLYGTFPKKIFLVPTLQTIDLIGNQELQGSLPDFLMNGSLQSLFLARTSFSGLLPESIGNLKVLSKLDLSYCNFTGPIPKSMAGLTELVYVDMSANKFNGSVPLWSMAKNLTQINLSYNELTGQINSTRWENLMNLVNLDLRFNRLNGRIPLSLFSHPSLKKLLLSNNQLSGQLFEFSSISSNPLDTLDLSSNNLKGPVPRSIFKLRGLKILSLSSNKFTGPFPLNSVQQLKNLSSLDLSYNSLLISYNSTNSSESSFPQITTFKLASGKLTTFPDFLRSQTRLSNLDLSQNQLHGEIPNWIWKLRSLGQLNLSCNSLVTLEGPLSNLTSSLSMLDLHSNQLQGQIPIFRPFAAYLDYSRNNFSSSIPDHIGDFLANTMFLSISSNKLEGSIPGSICNASYLQVLDLSNNSLGGSIPQCLTAISGTLVVLNLRRNRFSGLIPDRFPGHCSLKTLDLNENQLEGQFPKSLANCRELEVLNLGNNQITDTFPCLLKNISTLRVLVLRSNIFYGCIGCPNPIGPWPMLQIVDIAHNNFSGHLPGDRLTTWKAMMGNGNDSQSRINHLQFPVLRFSDVYYQDAITVTTKGLEMELIKILTVFTTIDISCNNFSGPIPEEVGKLKALYGLNLSKNALTGAIPPSLGNLTQLESLDLSNNNLSGKIPPKFTNLTFLSFLNLSHNQLVGSIPIGNQFSTFSPTSFEGNKGLCGVPLPVKCSNTIDSPDAAPKVNNNNKESGTGFDWQSIYTGLGFGVGAGVVAILLLLWEEGRNWMDDSIDKILLVILPMMGFTYRTRHEWDDDDDGEEDSEDDSMYFTEDYDQDEIESEDRGFQGPFCVFCSKLDMSRKSAIHNPNCTCHLSPPISSSSSSSSSLSS